MGNKLGKIFAYILVGGFILHSFFNMIDGVETNQVFGISLFSFIIGYEFGKRKTRN